MDGCRAPTAGAQARPPVAQRRVRARLPPGPLARQPASSSSTRSRARSAADADRRPAPRACRSRARSAAPSSATASSACCARRSARRRDRLPADHDVVVVARPEARELAEREGLEGVRARARRAARQGRRGEERAMARVTRRASSLAPIRALPARALAGAAAALQVRADLLGATRSQAIARVRHTARARAGGLAPAALQPVQPRRLRPRRGPAALPPPRPAPPHLTHDRRLRQHPPAADRRLRARSSSFFHDDVGLSWGLSIIALTVVVRALLLPLALKQYRSMQALQELAPEIKELQAEVQGRQAAPATRR